MSFTCSVEGLAVDDQVTRATGDPSMLDDHAGFETEAIWQLSLDTSWLDDQAGDASEGIAWVGLMGRYILVIDSHGFKESKDCESKESARAEFERIAAILDGDLERFAG